MLATKTVDDLRTESYSESLEAIESPALNICVEVGQVTVQTHTLPRVDVEARLRDVDLTVWQENDCVYVQAQNSDSGFAQDDANPKAEIVVTVPADCPLYAQVITGTLTVRDMAGPARTHVITGQSKLENLDGPIHATTVTGAIQYNGRLAGGAHHFAATTGAVNLALTELPDARVYAWATTGNVQCSLPLNATRRGGYLSGDHVYGVAGSGEGRVIAEVVTGSVKLQTV